MKKLILAACLLMLSLSQVASAEELDKSRWIEIQSASANGKNVTIYVSKDSADYDIKTDTATGYLAVDMPEKRQYEIHDLQVDFSKNTVAINNPVLYNYDDLKQKKLSGDLSNKARPGTVWEKIKNAVETVVKRDSKQRNQSNEEKAKKALQHFGIF